MFLLKNALTSIARNKGRNLLIGLIVVVIACASTVALAIRNTGNRIVEEYTAANEIVGYISFNRQALAVNFKEGEDAMKENIEAFNNIEQFTMDSLKEYGDSDYLKGFYYTYSASLNSDTLTKASDTFEYEVTDTKTSTKTSKDSSSKTQRPKGGDFPQPPTGEGGWNKVITNNIYTEKTITITKSMESFESSRNLTGDFQLDGYSSYDAMTDFIDGKLKIESGEIISDFSAFECVINSELASLNSLSVGDEITLKNPNTSAEYTFTITGIYTDNTDQGDVMNMYSRSVNTIIVGSQVIEQLAAEDETLVTSVTPSFVLNDEESIELFHAELKEKGLSDYYALSTNLDELQNATKSIANVTAFANTFLWITLGIAAVVLFVINMINIRERKYEIGVYRTIGLSKLKLTTQFVLELLTVSVIALMIGCGIGAACSQKVGNQLLQNEITNTMESVSQRNENFGRDDMFMEFNQGVMIGQIESLDAIVDMEVVLELLGIGLVLTLAGSLASMISIQRFSPLTILKERS